MSVRRTSVSNPPCRPVESMSVTATRQPAQVSRCYLRNAGGRSNKDGTQIMIAHRLAESLRQVTLNILGLLDTLIATAVHFPPHA